jgi:hypothetical protein
VITMAEITLAEIILKRDRSGRKSKKLWSLCLDFVTKGGRYVWNS